MKRTLFLFAAAALVGAGCADLFLPAGTPPDGAIVDNEPAAGEYTPRAAENYLVTSLSGFLLRESPGTPLALQSDAATRDTAERVLLALGPLCAVSIVPDSPLILRSDAEENCWNFQLFDSRTDTILWQEQLPIRRRSR